MKIKYVLLILVGVIFSTNIKAQNVDDLLRFSRYDYSFGTARSAAMGGAFSSLGADLSSSVLNPAGLGMYRKSEVSISPSVTNNTSIVTNYDDFGNFKTDVGKTKLTLNNFGAAFNVYEGSGAVTSFTFSFGYTKMADFNMNSNVRGSSKFSMIDAFGFQMANSGIIPPSNGSSIDFTSQNSAHWGGILAYNTMLLSYDDKGYFVENLFDVNNPIIDSRFKRTTNGSIGQYDISGGLNISNILYLGMGFGIQNIDYNETSNYKETPQNNAAFGLNNFSYIQGLKQSASAWNFKLGAILRPFDGLRLSAAIHTPTYINVEEYYYSDMNTFFNDFAPHKDGVELGEPISYNLQTPTRLILGGSYTLGHFGVISVDYERVWYNKMKAYQSGWDYDDMELNDVVSNVFKPVNNIRVGAEAVIAPSVYLRLGYAFYESMYANKALENYGKSSNYSWGMGYRTNGWSFDFAYIYMESKLPQTRLFDSGEFKSGLYEQKNERHNFTLTASVRF